MPERVNGSWVHGLDVRRCIRLLLVRHAIPRFVCLNTFVMYVVSLPVYVNVVHFCLDLCFCGCEGGRGGVVSERSCCEGCCGLYSLHYGIRQCVIGMYLDCCKGIYLLHIYVVWGGLKCMG
jgi:hypothetical protein